MGVTPASWAEALLNAIGAPETPQNVQAITAWEAAEGGNWANDARFNPLNTTMDASGAVAINSDGVKSYTSWDQGLGATVDTLAGSSYTGIRQALSAGDNAQAVADAVASSPWGTEPFSASLGTSLSQSQITAGLPAAEQLKGGTGVSTGPGSASLTSFNPLSGLASLPQAISNSVIMLPVILAGGALAVFGLVKATGIQRKTTEFIDDTKSTAAQAAAAGAAA